MLPSTIGSGERRTQRDRGVKAERSLSENQLKAIVIPLLPGIDQNVVVCVEENESGSSLLVEKVQQPQALEVGHQDDY